MRRRLPLALALVALLLAPPAAAQVPVPAPVACGPLEVQASVPARLAPGQSGHASVRVRNLGNLTVDVHVAMEILEPGWGGEETSKSRNGVGRGQSADFSFEIRPTADAAGDGTASFTVGGACASGSVVACPEDACAAPETTASGVVALDAPSGGGIPFLEGVDFSLPYLLAGVLVVAGLGAAPFLVARRRPRAVTARCPEPLKLVRPGRGASFPIEVRNPGAQPAVARLDVGAVPEGWTAFMPLPDVQLAPRESRDLFLMVRAPPEAAPGEAVEVELVVRDAAAPDRTSRVRVRAEVHADAAE